MAVSAIRSGARAASVLVTALALLAGCSGGALVEGSAQDRLTEVFPVLRLPVAGLPRGPVARGEPDLVVRDVPPAGPRLDATVARLGGVSPLVPVARNGAVTTWQAVDAVTVSLRDPGLLVATRGLPGDLMGADIAATAAALARGAAAEGLQRRHRYLGGDRRLADLAFACSLRPAGRETLRIGGTDRSTLRFEERCEGAGEVFTNRYWRDPARAVLWQSEQWIGPGPGHLRLQRVAE